MSAPSRRKGKGSKIGARTVYENQTFDEIQKAQVCFFSFLLFSSLFVLVFFFFLCYSFVFVLFSILFNFSFRLWNLWSKSFLGQCIHAPPISRVIGPMGLVRLSLFFLFLSLLLLSFSF